MTMKGNGFSVDQHGGFPFDDSIDTVAGHRACDHVADTGHRYSADGIIRLSANDTTTMSSGIP